MRFLRLILLTALSACAAAHQAGAQQPAELKEIKVGTSAFTLGDPVPSWVDRAALPEVTKVQPLVVRLADSQYLLDQVPVVYVRRAMQINDAASLTAAGRVSISFAPEYEHVQLHSIRIERGQEQLDRTTSSNIRFLQREQGLDYGVYSGRVTASILIDDLRVGDTLDIEYSTSGENPVFAGKFIGVAGWDQVYPTLRRRVVLNHPLDRHPTWRMVGDRPDAAITPKETVQNGVRRLEFDQLSLPETPVEALTSPDFFAFRFIQFSEFGSWNDVSRWATDLFEGKPVITDDLRTAIERIRALDTDEARVASALEFVQTQIRYFSVSLGESSHRPSPPDAVLRHRYGDCKDKSLLLVTLLRELGIQARPVLVQIGRRTGLEKTLPSPQFFNHVIVRAMLGDKSFFLDPTRLGQHGLLDHMGQAHPGAQVLLVAPDTSDLSRIADGDVELVQDEIVEHATIAKLGDEAQLEVKHVLRGVSAEQFRLAFERASHDQLLRGLGSAMERRYPGSKLASEPDIHDDPVQNVFSIVTTYKVPKFANERNGNWAVSFKPDNLLGAVASSPSAERKTALRIPRFPFHGKYSFEVTFPQEVSFTGDPNAQTVANDYFSMTTSDYFRGNIATKSVELTTLRADVEAANYPAFSDQLTAANKAIGGVIFVAKSIIKQDDAETRLSLTDRLRNTLEESVKKVGETISAGKITGPDLAEAYCLRSSSLGLLGRFDEALRDANSASRLAPNASNSMSCRGEINFQAGQFDSSIADHSKAIALGATNAIEFRGRGVSKFYAGRLEEAATDFAKASELADKETRIYCDIWLASTLGLLDKKLPEEVVKRAASEAQGEWPRPGLAMMTGAITPEDMLQSLQNKSGDDRDMALAEGYFYLGQHYLAAGDKKTAEAYFKKTREVGVIIYTEHIAAGFALKQLQGGGTANTAKQPAAAN